MHTFLRQTPFCKNTSPYTEFELSRALKKHFNAFLKFFRDI